MIFTGIAAIILISIIFLLALSLLNKLFTTYHKDHNKNTEAANIEKEAEQIEEQLKKLDQVCVKLRKIKKDLEE